MHLIAFVALMWVVRGELLLLLRCEVVQRDTELVRNCMLGSVDLLVCRVLDLVLLEDCLCFLVVEVLRCREVGVWVGVSDDFLVLYRDLSDDTGF